MNEPPPIFSVIAHAGMPFATDTRLCNALEVRASTTVGIQESSIAIAKCCT